tara:strand:+ start:104 stop:313 length:210 start_codon:yes stop_codon:yes gene_type:complete
MVALLAGQAYKEIRFTIFVWLIQAMSLIKTAYRLHKLKIFPGDLNDDGVSCNTFNTCRNSRNGDFATTE